MINNNDKKKLISNFLSLSTVRILNYILPFITVPYLVRVLGPDRFGLIAFSQAFIQYFNLISDYGFDLSATREISINRDDKKMVSAIFSSVMLLKMVFTILGFLILCLLVFNIDKFAKEKLLYLLTFGIVLGNVLFPIWFFRGIEKMKLIVMINILSKVIYVVSIFTFIKSQDDYIYIPLINSIGAIISGLVSLWIILIKFKVKLKIPTFIEIKHELKEGWDIFISKIAINLYTTSNIFILGLFTNNVIVGYYSAGNKIITAINGLIDPLSQTIYPHISKLASESKEMALSFVRKIIKLIGIPIFLISLSLFIFAPQIVNIVLGTQFKESIHVVQIMSFIIFIIFLSNIFGVQVMLNFGYQDVFKRIVINAGIINVILVSILSITFQHIGVAFAVLLIETYITCHQFIFLQQKGIKLIPIKEI